MVIFMQVSLRHTAAIIPIALLLALLLHFLLPTLHAHAHAGYNTSIPVANSTVKVAPTQVEITFLQSAEPASLKIMVYDNKGTVVSTGDAVLSTSDPKTATVPMKGDGSDIYRVDWQNVSAQDNDPDVGAFVFGVNPDGTAVDKVAATGTSSTNASSDGSSPLGIFLGLLGGLIVGAGGAYYFLKRPAA